MERYTTLSLAPRVHNTHTAVPWTEPQPQVHEDDAASWTRPNSEAKHHDEGFAMGAGAPLLPFFKPMPEPEPEPEPDYYINSAVVPIVSNPASGGNFLMHHQNISMDSFPLEPTPSQSHPFFNNNNSYYNSLFDTGFENGFFMGNHSSNSPVLTTGFSQSSASEFPPSLELEAFNAPFSKPTLFQKRRGPLEIPRLETGKKKWEEEEEEEEEEANFDDVDDSGLNCDSDENGNDLNNPNGTAVTGGDHKGKKKKKSGLPAKNLMAERRRRKKLNDRLYMLRSVVPKISKMDRASILGDAVDYLKELLQRINDLHNELESTPPGSLLPPSASFHPLTPTPPTLPCRVKDELYPSALPSPKNQPVKVEVRVREGRAVNIHMFCTRRPGLLLSTMRALDNLGLDVQQAVISCFNGFALDVFRAEQCREGQDVLPEQIRAVLLDSAGFHGMT